MNRIIRRDIDENWAHAGVVEAGDLVFTSYCVGAVGKPIEDQIHGALDHLSQRLQSVGLNLDAVVQVDCLFRDIWHIPVMEEVFKERFRGKYPARKSLQTEFAHVGGCEGLLFQLDAVAYREKN